MSATLSSSASLIASLLGNLFPLGATEKRGLFIGLDASGKTTILYKMKLGEVVTTIPTIGFNVETLEIPGSRVQFTLWDVGGCDKIRPLWRHYYQNTQCLIFIVDSNDLDRLDEAIQLFQDTAISEELHNIPILTFLNKADIVSAERLELVKRRIRAGLEGIRFGSARDNDSVFNFHKDNDGDSSGGGMTSAADDLYTELGHRVHICVCCAVTGDGLYEGFQWLSNQLEHWDSRKISSAPRPKPAVEAPRDKMEVMLEEWLTRVDDTDDVFLQKLKDYTLESWDHYTHLRIAHMLLLKHGRKDGMALIFELIKDFIANSPRTRRASADTRGTTFHETMTYFWVHMVHYAIASSTNYAVLSDKEDLTSGAGAKESDASLSTFKRFLLMNPQLCNGGLFLHYYSKQRMLLDPDARRMVVLPDKVPLPSLLVDMDRLKSNGKKQQITMITPRQPLSDVEFLQQCSQGKLEGWGHETKLRLIYLMLCCWGRRRGGTDEILRRIGTMEGEHSHFTVNYFWVQMITYHIMVEIVQQQKLHTKETEGMVFAAFSMEGFKCPPLTAAFSSDVSSDDDNDGETVNGESLMESLLVTTNMPFATFLLRPHCQALRNSLLYEKYYSRTAIDNETAAISFVLPDLKQLPNTVN